MDSQIERCHQGRTCRSAGLMLLLASNDIRLAEPDTWVSKAYAVRGRPATPVSYAGVARRTTAGRGRRRPQRR